MYITSLVYQISLLGARYTAGGPRRPSWTGHLSDGSKAPGRRGVAHTECSASTVSVCARHAHRLSAVRVCVVQQCIVRVHSNGDGDGSEPCEGHRERYDKRISRTSGDTPRTAPTYTRMPHRKSHVVPNVQPSYHASSPQSVLCCACACCRVVSCLWRAARCRSRGVRG